MAGTSETLLEARIISTAFGCLSSGSAGGDRSGGTNRSSCVFVMGSVVAVRKMDPGQVAKRIQGAGAGLALNSLQRTMGPASLGAREQIHTVLQIPHVPLSQREARHHQCS